MTVDNNGSVDAKVLAVTQSKWGDDLTHFPVTDNFRLMHAYLVLGDRDHALRCYQTVVEDTTTLANDMGQMIPMEMVFGRQFGELHRILYER